MITEKLIYVLYKRGDIVLIPNPLGQGTACKMGNRAMIGFDPKAQTMNPETYKYTFPKEYIAHQIFEYICRLSWERNPDFLKIEAYIAECARNLTETTNTTNQSGQMVRDDILYNEDNHVYKYLQKIPTAYLIEELKHRTR